MPDLYAANAPMPACVRRTSRDGRAGHRRAQHTRHLAYDYSYTVLVWGTHSAPLFRSAEHTTRAGRITMVIPSPLGGTHLAPQLGGTHPAPPRRAAARA